MPLILDKSQIAEAVRQLADQIAAAHPDGTLNIVGIRSRGDEVAQRVCDILQNAGRETQLGILDISLYRDDLAHLHQNPKLQGSEIDFPIDGARLTLVDDVLFTGRTIRAALDALTDYGRPGAIELAVLIDRGHRELPIEPRYVGKKLETSRLDHVIVKLEKTDGEDSVELVENRS